MIKQDLRVLLDFFMDDENHTNFLGYLISHVLKLLIFDLYAGCYKIEKQIKWVIYSIKRMKKYRGTIFLKSGIELRIQGVLP